MTNSIVPHCAQISTKCNYRFIAATDEQLARLIMRLLKGGQGMYKTIMEGLERGDEAMGKLVVQAINQFKAAELTEKGMRVEETHNLVPSVLRNSLATLISGTTVTPTFKANYFALGTGSAAPTNGDIQLGTETIRSLFTNRYSSSNVAYMDVFFGTALVGGNSYNEAGIFVDASASANSGYLLSRTAQAIVLGASQTLTVNCSITIS